MKAFFWLLLWCLCLPSSFGSGKESHGGGAWVKRNTDNSIADAELLDFWEARARSIWGQVIEPSSESVGRQIERGIRKLKRLNSEFGEDVDKAYAYLLSKKREITEEGVGIAPPKDLNHRFVKTGYQLEGAASFDEETQELLIDPRILDAFKSNSERAGLYLHEAVYKALRDRGVATDSRRARRVTGYLFSDYAWVGTAEGLPREYVICESQRNEEWKATQYQFYAYPKGPQEGLEQNYVLQFYSIDNLPLLEKTTAELKLFAGHLSVDEDPRMDARGIAEQLRAQGDRKGLFDWLRRRFTTASKFEPKYELELKAFFDDPYYDSSSRAQFRASVWNVGRNQTPHPSLACRPNR